MVRAVFTVSGLLSLRGLTGAGGDRITRTRAREKIPRSTGGGTRQGAKNAGILDREQRRALGIVRQEVRQDREPDTGKDTGRTLGLRIGHGPE